MNSVGLSKTVISNLSLKTSKKIVDPKSDFELKAENFGGTLMGLQHLKLKTLRLPFQLEQPSVLHIDRLNCPMGIGFYRLWMAALCLYSFIPDVVALPFRY